MTAGILCCFFAWKWFQHYKQAEQQTTNQLKIILYSEFATVYTL